VGYAIYKALFDINNLVGSVLNVVSISAANPGVITTDLNHLFLAGNTFTIADSNPPGYDGTFQVIAVPSEKTLSYGVPYESNGVSSAAWAGGTATVDTLSPHGVTVGTTFTLANFAPAGWNGSFVAGAGTAGNVLSFPIASDPGAATTLGQLLAGVSPFDTTGLPAYVGSAVLTPNPRTISVSLIDYPDTYIVPFVNPPQQSVAFNIQWQTTSTNIVSPPAVAQLAAQPLTDYVNSITAGKPINLYQMEDVFADAVESVLPPALISLISISVSINGVGTAPSPGTHLVYGDPESYFFANVSDFNITQA
jgi:hypothetical protein